MYPAYELLARSERAAKAQPDEAVKRCEGAALPRAEHYGGSQGDFSRARSRALRQCLLPLLANVDRETTADFAGFFIHRAVQGVPINRGRT